MDARKLIEKSINDLLQRNAFYANFFLNSTVRYDVKEIPTAGATVTRKGPLLLFNSEFISSLTSKEVTAVLEHEILHLLFEHCLVPHKMEGILAKVSNIAMDCAINQWIDGLPEMCVTLKGLEEMLKTTLEPKQTWEYYYSKIVQNPEMMEKLTEKFGEFDVHLPADADLSSAEGRARLRDAMDKAIKASKGNVSSEILKIFDSLNAPSKIAWQQVLANFVARSVSNTLQYTRKKINRRFGLEQPGKKRKRELTLGVCLDSSGSISDSDFETFLAEVQRISKLCSKVYLVDADCEVHSVDVLDKRKKLKFERRGNGGTAYQPAIDECMKRSCDAIVYFGDGDTADTPQNPGIPFLWVLVGNGKKPGDFGSEIHL